MAILFVVWPVFVKSTEWHKLQTTRQPPPTIPSGPKQEHTTKTMARKRASLNDRFQIFKGYLHREK